MCQCQPKIPLVRNPRPGEKLCDCSICGAPVLHGLPVAWDSDWEPVHQACMERDLKMEIMHMSEVGLLSVEERCLLQ
jgi:hypothetical protein